MKILAGKILAGLVRIYLRIAAPFEDTAAFKGMLRWYRHRGIRIIQRFIPLFGNFVMVSLTSRCQCSCRHCGVSHQKKHGEFELDKTGVYGIIDEIHNLGAYSVYFFGGEPLLVPELFSYIAYAKRKKLRTRLDTNGLLLDEDMVVRLKKAGLDEIGISVDSLDSEIHDTNRGIKGALQKALNGISCCNARKLKCYISTVASRQSLRNGDFQKIFHMAGKSGNKVRVLSPILCGRWESRADLALTPADVRLLRGFLKRGTIFWDSELVDTKDSPFLCSSMARRTIYISPDGDVQPCCYVPISYGNIRLEPLAVIVEKMRNSDLYSAGRYFPDCPTNSTYFQARYGREPHSSKVPTPALSPCDK
jgi:MoaA/NifB/PqqE/SkfB family radical SAM enzyme